MKNKNCPLCKIKKSEELLYDDDLIYVCHCINHPDKVIVVIKRHSDQPTKNEILAFAEVKSKLFRDGTFRGPKNNKGHWYWHEK